MLGVPRHILQLCVGWCRWGMTHDRAGSATLQQAALTIKRHAMSSDIVMSRLDMLMNSKLTFTLADAVMSTTIVLMTAS